MAAETANGLGGHILAISIELDRARGHLDLLQRLSFDGLSGRMVLQSRFQKSN